MTKVWEFDDLVVKLDLVGTKEAYYRYKRFIERQIFKYGECMVRTPGCGISRWYIPFPGVYRKETGQVW